MANADFTALAQDSLIAGNTIRLFGTEFAALTVVPAKLGARQIDPTRSAEAPSLARIFGFSYQGHYHKLANPTVFLVYGKGDPVPSDPIKATLFQVGVEYKAEAFADGVLAWAAYDVDFGVRIDITAGWMSEILIAPEASDPSGSQGGCDGGAAPPRNRLVGRNNCLVGRVAAMGRPPNC